MLELMPSIIFVAISKTRLGSAIRLLLGDLIIAFSVLVFASEILVLRDMKRLCIFFSSCLISRPFKSA